MVAGGAGWPDHTEGHPTHPADTFLPVSGHQWRKNPGISLLTVKETRVNTRTNVDSEQSMKRDGSESLEANQSEMERSE